MACVACAWQESVNPNLLSQDTQKISFSSAAFELITSKVFQNSKHRGAAPGRNESIRSERGEVPQEKRIKECFEEHSTRPDVWCHLSAQPCSVLSQTPQEPSQLQGTSCPSCQKPFRGNLAVGIWLMCQESPKEMREVTLLLPQKKSPDNVSTVLLRKGFFLSMFLFLQKEKQTSKRWQKKKYFYGSPLKNAASMKPFEFAGSTSVKPNVSLS